MIKQTVVLLIYLISAAVTCFGQTEQVDSLRKILLSEPNDTSKVHTLLAMSKRLSSTSSSEAIAYAMRAKELADSLNFQKGVANAYKYIGIGYYWQGNYLEAIHNYQKSLEIFDSIDDKVGIANIQNNLGAIYFDQSDDDKALEYYLKSLQASEEANDTVRMLTAYMNIGGVYSNKSKTYDKALEYYQRALPLSLAIGDKESIGTITSNIGEVYFKRNEDSLALIYFNRSLKAFENSEDKAYPLNYIGRVYQNRNDSKSALKYHQEAYDFASKSDAKLDMTQSLLGIATAQRQSGLLEESIRTYKKAEEIARSLSANQELKEIYEGLAIAYQAKNDFSNAFRYQTLVTAIKDTLYNIDADKKLQGLQFTFDLEKKESKINLLTKDYEIQQQLIGRQKLVRNGFIGGFIITLLFASVFFSQRNRISKEKNRSDALLLNILPAETADELKETGTAKAKSFDMVSVMFTDFKNFTQASEKLSAEELVQQINQCYCEFDRIISKYNIEKIKTIGDSYMCAAGLPITSNTHAVDIVKAGLEMQQFMTKHKQERIEQAQPYFELRLGIHSGPVVAGIVGIKKFAYDIWGDTVNTASRMESSGEVGEVNISSVTYSLIKDKFRCTHRGKIVAKNKGEIDMYFVNGPV